MGLVRIVVVAALLVGTGLPLALVLARGRPSLARLVFEAGVVGTAIQVVVGIVALRAGRFSLPVLAALTGIVVAASGVTLLLRGAPRPWARVDRDSLVVLLLVSPIALVVRLDPSYFVFQTGDMGEYVNTANDIARGGALAAGFLHGFTVLLGETALLLGTAHTVAVVPALGLLFVVGTYVLLADLRLPPVAVWVVTGLAAVHPVAVWFSVFPASEGLYAVLLLGVLHLLAVAHRERSLPHAAGVGVLVGVMLLVRGNALVLLAIAVLVAVATALVGDRPAYLVQRAVAVVAAAACAAAWIYDVRFPTEYFVERQLRSFLPGPAFDLAERAGWFEVSPSSIAAALVAPLALTAVLVAARHLGRGLRRHDLDLVWTGMGAAVVLGTVAVVFRVGGSGLADGVLRWGPALALLAGAGAAVMVRSPLRFGRELGPWSVTTLLAGGAGLALYADRFPEPRGHAYFLYWDRYLFSEAMPVALVLGAVALGAGVELLSSARVPYRNVAAGALAVAVLAASVPLLAVTREAVRHPLFGDPHTALRTLDELTTDEGRPLPVVYVGSAAPPEGWFFPNTFRAFALPLHQTWGRTVLALPSDPFGPDPAAGPAGVHDVLVDAGVPEAFVVTRRVGEPDAAFLADPAARFVGSVAYDVPLLGRSPDWRARPRFRTVEVVLDVFHVEADVGTVAPTAVAAGTGRSG